MDDLLEEMWPCKSVQACIDLALTDAYGEEEEDVAWLTCIETMSSRFKQVKREIGYAPRSELRSPTPTA